MKKQWKKLAILCVLVCLLSGCSRGEAQKAGEDELENALQTEIVVSTELLEKPEETVTTEEETLVEEITEISTEVTEIANVEVKEEVGTTQEAILEEYLTSPYDYEMAREVFDLVNEVRIEYGLHPLEWDDRLYNTASVRAKEAVEVWSHTRPDGTRWTTLSTPDILNGENLARGYSKDQVVDAWMNSQTHKENILRKEFVRGAISVYWSEFGMEYMCQHFGCGPFD